MIFLWHHGSVKLLFRAGGAIRTCFESFIPSLPGVRTQNLFRIFHDDARKAHAARCRNAVVVVLTNSMSVSKHESERQSFSTKSFRKMDLDWISKHDNTRLQETESRMKNRQES